MLLLLTVRELAFCCAVSGMCSSCSAMSEVNDTAPVEGDLMSNGLPCAAGICAKSCSVDPIIFRGLKSLTFKDTQQSSLLRLAAEGISVSI